MEVSAAVIGNINGVHWRLNAAAGKSTSICFVGESLSARESAARSDLENESKRNGNPHNFGHVCPSQFNVATD